MVFRRGREFLMRTAMKRFGKVEELTNPCAIARPIPEVPPMTTATLPVRSNAL